MATLLGDVVGDRSGAPSRRLVDLITRLVAKDPGRPSELGGGGRGRPRRHRQCRRPPATPSGEAAAVGPADATPRRQTAEQPLTGTQLGAAADAPPAARGGAIVGSIAAAVLAAGRRRRHRGRREPRRRWSGRGYDDGDAVVVPDSRPRQVRHRHRPGAPLSSGGHRAAGRPIATAPAVGRAAPRRHRHGRVDTGAQPSPPPPRRKHADAEHDRLDRPVAPLPTRASRPSWRFRRAPSRRTAGHRAAQPRPPGGSDPDGRRRVRRRPRGSQPGLDGRIRPNPTPTALSTSSWPAPDGRRRSTSSRRRDQRGGDRRLHDRATSCSVDRGNDDVRKSCSDACGLDAVVRRRRGRPARGHRRDRRRRRPRRHGGQRAHRRRPRRRPEPGVRRVHRVRIARHHGDPAGAARGAAAGAAPLSCRRHGPARRGRGRPGDDAAAGAVAGARVLGSSSRSSSSVSSPCSTPGSRLPSPSTARSGRVAISPRSPTWRSP